jgi:hypothetical protein
MITAQKEKPMQDHDHLSERKKSQCRIMTTSQKERKANAGSRSPLRKKKAHESLTRWGSWSCILTMTSFGVSLSKYMINNTQRIAMRCDHDVLPRLQLRHHLFAQHIPSTAQVQNLESNWRRWCSQKMVSKTLTFSTKYLTTRSAHISRLSPLGGGMSFRRLLLVQALQFTIPAHHKSIPGLASPFSLLANPSWGSQTPQWAWICLHASVSMELPCGDHGDDLVCVAEDPAPRLGPLASLWRITGTWNRDELAHDVKDRRSLQNRVSGNGERNMRGAHLLEMVLRHCERYIVDGIFSFKIWKRVDFYTYISQTQY